MNRYYKHYKFATLQRGPILDIGSGSNPFWRANVLMDRFLDDDSQRPGKLIIDRPMVCGDIHNIPFIDNSFSFIHCSHILEHLTNPEKAITEMMRVSKSGYIEIPSEIHEYLDLNLPYHLWSISLEDDVIVFREKSQVKHDHPLITALMNQKNRTSKFLRDNHDYINMIPIFWHGDIKYRVERFNYNISSYNTNNEPVSSTHYAINPLKSKLKLLLSRVFSFNVNIYDLIACPMCKNNISYNESLLTCHHCNKVFPIVNGVPMLTRDFASLY